MIQIFLKNKGQSLVELMIVIGLFAAILPPILLGMIGSRKGQPQTDQRVMAIAFLKETEEAVRSMRNAGWSNISSLQTDTVYHPVISGSSWSLVASAETINDLTRTVILSDVCRDNNGVGSVANCPANGSIVNDPSSKRVDVNISWTVPSPNSISTTIYLTRYQENLTYIQHSQADFNGDTLSNVTVSNVSGNPINGQVQLATNTKAKWCSPAYTHDLGGNEVTIDLPDGPPVAVTARADANDASVPNDVLVAIAPQDSNIFKMAYVNVTANTDPPSATLRGKFTMDQAQYTAGTFPQNTGLDNNFSTNDIKYYTSSSGKLYALLATDLPDKEVLALLVNDNDDVSNSEYQDSAHGIYKYWTYFNTRMFGTAFNNPSANAADTTNAGDNNGYQSNATEAYISDGTNASDTNSGSGSSTNCTGSDKDKHRFYNYNFSVPNGVAINGIEINLAARADSSNNSPKICIQLSWDGGTTWTTAQSTSQLTNNTALYTLGGATDTWGRTWNDTDFSNANFRVRVIDVASSTQRDFYLDWIGAKVYYNGGSTGANDQAPFDYGAKAITVLNDKGYVASGGYLYVFDLTNIDSKSPSDSLDQVGCRIELDGFDCQIGNSYDRKYDAGETGTVWCQSNSNSCRTGAQPNCQDGGNTELFANNDLSGVQVSGHNYIYVAVGAGTDPEFDLVDATSVPDGASSPSISSYSCGRISGGNNGWKRLSSIDFNNVGGTQEAANSVFAKSDGTRAYISSNGGVDANGDRIHDSDQFYIINTSNKSNPQFLSGSSNGGPTSGYYYGGAITPSPAGPVYLNDQMYPRRSMTVLNGQRAVLVGKTAPTPTPHGLSPTPTPFNVQEYQVINIDPTDPGGNKESSPTYCGGVDFSNGFNDLTSVTESDQDTFVYMVANTPDHQLKIIEGGPDGVYNQAGTIESPIYTLGYSTAFNHFDAIVDKPAGTDIQFQFAIADTVNGSCTDANYVYTGPDGTVGTKYSSTGGALFLDDDSSGYENPGTCFRYKAFLSTSAPYSTTPTLYDVTVNYSP